MDDVALAQLKAASTNVLAPKLAKRVRVVNTAVKHSSNGFSTPQPSVSPDGMWSVTRDRSPSSDTFPSSTSPIADVFDDADEDSRPSVLASLNKKRKSPTGSTRAGDDDDHYGSGSDVKSSSNNGSKRSVRKWPDASNSKKRDTSEKVIQEAVEKFRKQKRSTDTQLAQFPNDTSLFDNYLWASLGFFEAAAMYEEHAKQHAGEEGGEIFRRCITLALDLYTGLAPKSEQSTLLTYYVSKCEQAKLTMRAVLGRRCLAMAFARLFHLYHKQVFAALAATIKRASNQETVDVKLSHLSEMAVVYRLVDGFERSESDARLRPDVFTPFPKHPLELDPFEFLEYIREEYLAVAQAEPTTTSSSGASTPSPGGHASSSTHLSSSSSSASSSSSSSSSQRSHSITKSNGSSGHQQHHHRR